MTNPFRVCFIQVSDNNTKLQKISAVIYDHFVKNDKVLIAVPSNEAALYIDQLLWKMPEESFLPHSISNFPTKERVTITTSLTNVNQASILINLLTDLHPDPGPVNMIYELLDLTSKDKELISRKKHAAYTNAGHQLQMN